MFKTLVRIVKFEFMDRRTLDRSSKRQAIPPIPNSRTMFEPQAPRL
jgi:hypothetical protein